MGWYSFMPIGYVAILRAEGTSQTSIVLTSPRKATLLLSSDCQFCTYLGIEKSEESSRITTFSFQIKMSSSPVCSVLQPVKKTINEHKRKKREPRFFSFPNGI